MSEVPRRTEIEGAVLQMRKIGNSLGFILSKELLARLEAERGRPASRRRTAGPWREADAV